MKEVNVYLASSIRGRWPRDGYIGYALEYYPPGKNMPAVLRCCEPVQNMNENRAQLEALILVFTRMREKCILSIYTESQYLYDGFAGPEHVKKWIKNHWQTARGQEVKNRDKWEELLRGLQGNLYTFYLRQPNAYTPGLLEELKRKEGAGQ